MPHLVIEHSSNVTSDITGLVEAAHIAAVTAGPFPLGGIRTRARCVDTYAVADGNPDHRFVHIHLTVGPGRPTDVLQAAGQMIFDAVSDHVAAEQEKHGLALSMYISESNAELSWKRNNLHDRLDTP